MGCSPDFWLKTTSIICIRSLIVRSKLDALVHLGIPSSALVKLGRPLKTEYGLLNCLRVCHLRVCLAQMQNPVQCILAFKSVGDRGLLADSLQFSTIMSVHTVAHVYCVAPGELLSSS